MNIARLIVGLALCSLAVACQAPDSAPSPGRGEWYPAPMNDPQISVLAPELRPHLAFQPAIITKDGERAMSVEVPMRNSTYNRYMLDFRILFYDINGRELAPVMGWEFVNLEPKQIVRLKRAAMSNEAESYRLEVKWSR